MGAFDGLTGSELVELGKEIRSLTPSQEKAPLFTWNVDNDYYKPKVSVYEDGSLLICVGGECIRCPIESWFNSIKDKP